MRRSICVVGLLNCQNGLVNFAPRLSMFLMTLLGGAIADLLLKKNLLSTTNVRKLAIALGKWTAVPLNDRQHLSNLSQ